MASKNELSPVMQQYIGMKEQVPDALLLFRLGDFFEAFFNDARIISKALDLVLTKRGTDADGKLIPMCGIPAHALDNYMGRLVRAGFRVALADQMETPDQMKARGAKQIRREIVRVVTPGTLTDQSLLPATSQNILLCAVRHGQDWYLAACEISTGEFLVGTASFDIFDIISKLNPAEIIMPEELSEDQTTIKLKKNHIIHFLHRNISERSDTIEIKHKIFGKRNFLDNPAVDLLAVYLNQTQRGASLIFQAPKGFNAGNILSIDASSFESLEIEKALRPDGSSLLDVIDHSRTSMGARKLKSLLRELPMDAAEISARQDTIEFLIKNRPLADDICALLTNTPDISRSMTRLISGRGMPMDLAAAREFTKLAAKFKDAGSKMNPGMADKFVKISDFMSLRTLLGQALSDEMPGAFREGGTIRQGYNQPLDHLRDLGGNAKGTIASLQKTYIDQTGISTLKIKFNNMLGYFVEVQSKYAAGLMDKDSGFIHRQTIANNMRFTTIRLSDLDAEIRTSMDKANALEQELIAALIDEVSKVSADIIEASNLIAELDVWMSLAETAQEFYWTRPKIVSESVLDIRGGKHPVVEKIMRAHANTFIPNDCELTGGAKGINVITGPNMAGKSTYLRQNALIIILAHLGSFVPATSATIGLCDKLFSRVGASDNLAQGQSTFMVEMSETASILKNASGRSFVILDEIGRGTATWDGMAIAQATLEFLNELSPRALFATHYHELTELKLKSLKFSTMQVKDDGSDIVFMYKVVPDGAGKSYGIHVAKLAGMPDSVVARAEQILKKLEKQEKPAAPKPLTQPSLFE